MHKLLKLTSAALLAMSFAACSATSNTTEDAEKPTDEAPAETAADLSGTYTYHVSGYDWGAGVDQVVVTLSGKVDSVDKDTFTVSEFKNATDYTSENFDVIETTFDR